jgi:hypothetical protein
MEAFADIIEKSLLPVLPPSVIERLNKFTPLEWDKFEEKINTLKNEHVKNASLAVLRTLRQFHGDVSTPAELISVGLLDSVVVSGFLWVPLLAFSSFTILPQKNTPL